MTSSFQPTSGEPPPYDVAIIGGGISGLATAYYLQKHAVEAGQSLDYTLIERDAEIGGKLRTEHVDGFGDTPFVIEAGPDSFLTQKPWALELARELDLDDQLLGTNDHKRKTFVLNRGKPTPLPDGVLLIVPTRFMPFALSPLISPLGKLRMGMDLMLPARRDEEDETLAEFIRRRLGSEALDKIAEPLLSGIYNADSERQSIMATFPRLGHIDRRHGSLIRGMLASGRHRAGSAAGQSDGAAGGSRPPAMFMTLHHGIQDLATALVPKLTGDIRLQTAVESIVPPPARGDEPQQPYTLSLNDGSTLRAHQIVLAVPAFAAADLLDPIADQAAANLRDIRYVSTGTLSLGYRRDQIRHPLNGFGLVIPRSEQRPINAVTWTSTKFDHRAPQDHVLLRVFFGGSRNPEMVDRSDEELLTTARSQLLDIMGIDAEPVMHRLYRWRDATPQYDVGHLTRVEAIEAALPPNLYVTGCPYRGIGIPDCVHQGQMTAEAVWSARRTAPSTAEA